MDKQITNTILMVRPAHFRYNEQTAKDNFFMHRVKDQNQKTIEQSAQDEFDGMVDLLESSGVKVIVGFDISSTDTPDAVFPNNWVSFHENGTMITYPMFAPNRRLERKLDVKNLLSKNNFIINNVIDLSSLENEDTYLEGTGSLVLDRQHKIGYAAISERTHESAVKMFAASFNYDCFCFHANQTHHNKRVPIYHTNVMMSIGETYALICLQAIDDDAERKNIIDRLSGSGKEIIPITEEQIQHFMGNTLQILNSEGQRMVFMSSNAYDALSKQQEVALLKHNDRILHSDVSTIEKLGGGSTRCMMAEVFLPHI